MRALVGPVAVVILLAACPDREILVAGKDAVVALEDASADAGVAPVDAATVDQGLVVDAGAVDAADAASAPDATVADVATVADAAAADAGSQDQPIAVDATLPPDAGAGQITGCIEGNFAPAFGNLHAHTSASDGEGSFEEAFAYARDQGGLDFFFVTDHVEQLYGLDGEPSDEWETCWTQADLANADGSYVAMCGFEHGSAMSLRPLGPAGHCNVFFSDGLFPAIQLRLSELYASIEACTDCVTQFNHPLDDASMSFGDFAYDPEVDARMNLLEFNTGADAWDVLNQALEAGWHVSPTWNQDNHSANWGTANARRTGLFLAALTRGDVEQAMRQRRSFATPDRNAWIRLLADACWMGSVVHGMDHAILRAEVADADDVFDRIELYGPRQSLLTSIPCGGRLSCGGEFELWVSQPLYAIARGIQADGDVVTSAPIWLAP